MLTLEEGDADGKADDEDIESDEDKEGVKAVEEEEHCSFAFDEEDVYRIFNNEHMNRNVDCRSLTCSSPFLVDLDNTNCLSMGFLDRCLYIEITVVPVNRPIRATCQILSVR